MKTINAIAAWHDERLLQLARAEVEMAAATFLLYYGKRIAREEEDVLTRAGAARPALRRQIALEA